MAKHNELGKIGENVAVEYLAEKGYRILERNWKYRKNEIDIIAGIKGFVVVIEVKSRSTNFFGDPEEFVTKAKQKRLIVAADYYLQNIDFEAEVRYDIISVLKNGDRFKVNHIKDAFIPTID